MFEAKVRKYVESGKSGSISVWKISEGGESSLGWASFDLALTELNAPSSLGINKDKGEITPSCPEDWQWVEAVSHPGFAFKINSQDAAHANSLFSGNFSDGTSARDIRDWARIQKDQRQTETGRIDAGYGKSRMGGFVEM